MHAGQEALNAAWADRGLPPFGLGIGLSTGQVAAALLGSRDRVEYTVVGDTVTWPPACATRPARPAYRRQRGHRRRNQPAEDYELLPALRVKGRAATVAAYRRSPSSPSGVTRDATKSAIAERPSQL